jgi:hypothetical protein
MISLSLRGLTSSCHIIDITMHGGEVHHDRLLSLLCCNQLVAQMQDTRPRLEGECHGNVRPHIGSCRLTGNTRYHFPRKRGHQVREHMLITHAPRYIFWVRNDHLLGILFYLKSPLRCSFRANLLIVPRGSPIRLGRATNDSCLLSFFRDGNGERGRDIGRGRWAHHW